MAALKRSLRQRGRSESGAELIEFGLVFPLLLLVVLGIFDFGLLFQQYEVITNAAREGARIAVLPAYSTTLALQKANAKARVDQYIAASFLSGGSVAWNTNFTTVANPVNVSIGGNCMTTVTVTVTYPHSFIFLSGIASLFGGGFGTATLTASSAMRTEIAASPCP